VATPVVTVAPAVPAVLSAEADAALKAAELSVNEARLKRALWTAAVKQLGPARDARAFDSAATLSHAREVIALCNPVLAATIGATGQVVIENKICIEEQPT
jgi:hypothetical protein